MFDGKLFGYIAVGNEIVFRPFCGPDAHVMFVPEDIDSHMLARALNDSGNSIMHVVQSCSQFKM